MNKLMWTALVALAGCTAQSQPGAAVGTARQAETATPGELRHLPKLRYVTPGSTGGGGATGGGGGGGATDAWQPLANQPSMYAGTALLLTDGSVMVQDAGTSNWWKLVPDASGSYVAGTWTALAAMPDGYAPLYFASAVLPDGRVVVEGGEYQNFEPSWTTRGAIYDPVADAWTAIAPPTGWETIGDAQSAVLADGRFLLANCCSTESALLDVKQLTWSGFGTGKADIFDEEGWTLLPSGKLLTVDANLPDDLTASEIFSPSTGAWTSAGSTVVQLPDTDPDDGGSHELGPVLLRPDGTAFAAGATGHTAIYHSHSGKWTAGPDFPVVAGEGQLDVADGPATLFPDGRVLVVASAGIFNTPAHFLVFDGKAFTEVAAPPGATYDSSYNVNLLPLPNGQILMTDFSNDVEVFTPSGKAPCGWEPVVEKSCALDSLTPGKSYRLTGQRLNGLSQAQSYGDDVQAATNYPLVRITNRATGHVAYARTHDHSSMSVNPTTRSSTWFDVPAAIDAGKSELVVVANGIASQPIDVTVVALTK
jgi:hypothetical protein